MTQWSPQQDNALRLVDEWLRNDEQIFYLAGYAGTGKTTLAKHFAEGVEGTVLFAAYTGKAALVLRRKGCVNASTIHKLIYTPAGETGGPDTDGLYVELKELEDRLKLMPPPVEKNPDVAGIDFNMMRANGPRMDLERKIQFLRQKILVEERRKATPMFHLNEDSPVRNAKLVVLDESSMIDGQMAEDILSYGTKILVLGDPAQLPPVANAGFFTERRPDFLLTEIHRQAQESGILQLATLVRQGEHISHGKYGDDCEVIRAGHSSVQEIVLDADQILVGRNKTRHISNQRFRVLTGRGKINEHLPEPGDKLVCLRNNHEAGLLNGSLWRVHEASHFPEQQVCEMTISSEEDADVTGVMVSAHLHHFLGNEAELRKMGWNKKDHEEFDYGYALTVHKSQGSQWDDVALFDESGSFRQDARKWLYTGVTRAARKLTVIK